jgi:hypothetical protein
MCGSALPEIRGGEQLPGDDAGEGELEWGGGDVDDVAEGAAGESAGGGVVSVVRPGRRGSGWRVAARTSSAPPPCWPFGVEPSPHHRPWNLLGREILGLAEAKPHSHRPANPVERTAGAEVRRPLEGSPNTRSKPWA